MIQQAFKGFYEILKNPWILNRILDDNSVWENYISKKHPSFKKGLPVVEITDLIPGFKETLDTVTYLGGGSTVPDLCMIKALCKTFQNCTYFELGTWMGESVANASEVCSECTTFNIDPNTYVNGKYKDIMGFFSKNLKNVKQLYGNSRTFDFAGLNKKFDVVFIDADHHHAFIKSDTENIFKHLIHDNSIIIWHDYGNSPSVPRFETLAAILEGIPSTLHNNLYHVSNTLSAIYTKRRLSVRELNSMAIPSKKFRVSIESLPV